MRILWVIILIAIDVFIPGNGETIAGLILARGGSKGVRLKNLQKLGGQSLVRRTVTVAQAAGLVDITVATDHPLIALEALRCNASVFHRSTVTATDTAPSIWAVSEFLVHRPDVDILILLQATSPFVKPSHVKLAMRKINTPIAYDCVFSVTRSFKLRWHMKNGRLEPLNFKVDKRPRRQDWRGELLENGAFYITRRHILNEGKFQNDKYARSSAKTLTLYLTTILWEVQIFTYVLKLSNSIQILNFEDRLIRIYAQKIFVFMLRNILFLPFLCKFFIQHTQGKEPYYDTHPTTVPQKYYKFEKGAKSLVADNDIKLINNTMGVLAGTWKGSSGRIVLFY